VRKHCAARFGRENLLLSKVQASASELDTPRARRDIVLIVEDDPGTARAVGRLVRSTGLLPRVAACAREALGALGKAHELRALIVDLALPDGNGLWVAEAARRCAASLPIVIITGASSSSVINQAFRVGAQYLCKPLGAKDVASLRLFLLGAPPQPVIERLQQWAQDKGLQAHETELLTLAFAGCNARAMSEQLGVSQSAVEHHIQNLLCGLGARDLESVVRVLRDITEAKSPA
jgi:FixJ family two-component response regulator